MNSKPNDSADVLAGTKASDEAESNLPTAGETRSERIRRLNRERQRRRREKIKMSRHNEATSTSSNGSGSDNTQFQTDGDNFETTVKVELQIPTEHIQEDPKSTRPKKQTRRSQQVRDEEIFEPNLSLPASSANNAILPACHDNNSKFNASSDAPELSAVPVVAREVEVVEEKPQENGAEAFTDSLAVPTTSTEKPKRRTRESNRKRVEKLTVVDLDESDIKRDFHRDRERKKRQSMTHDEVTARRVKQRELKRKQKERMTSDQVEALRARYREWRRKRKETMTSDQLEVIRKGNRERQRRRRERLGIKKRQAIPQMKGVSEEVIRGLKNKQAHGIASLKSSEPLGDAAALMQAVNVVMNPENPTASVIMSAQRAEPTMGHVTSANSVTGMQTITPTGMALNVAATTSSTTASSATEVTTLPSMPVIGTPGSFLPSMAASPMQGTLLHGMAGIPGAFLSGISTTPNTVSVSQGSLQSTILPGMNTQGAFLSGIPGAQIPGLAGLHGFASMPAQIGKDGQILHSISTLLPIAPVQGAAGQGVTFLAPFSGTGQIQGFPDARYSLAGSVRSVTPMATSQTVSAAMDNSSPKVAASVASSSDDSHVVTPADGKADTAPPKRTRTRGRKRATSAAEMLVNLSNLPPTNTPMANMLSAMASAHEGHGANPTVVNTEKPVSEAPPSKRQTLPSDISTNVQASSMQLSGGNVNEATAGVGMVSMYPGADLASQSMPAKIPHMSTFLTAMGGGGIPSMPFMTTGYAGRSHNSLNPGQFFGHYIPGRISVAVETDEIRRSSVGTNTVRKNYVLPDDSVMISTGTMTDSLYKVSVGTDMVKPNSLSAGEDCRIENVEVVSVEEGTSVANQSSMDTECVGARFVDNKEMVTPDEISDHVETEQPHQGISKSSNSGTI